ncbi:MAG: class I SAM-dependent methyltransferase [Acidobacteriota bacterium]
MNNIREMFGDIDIYLFDQIQKGRFPPGIKILDAGCGGGRNIIWFIRNGFEVFAIDKDANAVVTVREIAKGLAPQLSSENFKIASLESIPFLDEEFDLVICNAVLHFASDLAEFDQWIAQLWRVLKPGGIFFSRLASSIGIEKMLVATANGRYLLPDGTERFVVDEQCLKDTTSRIGGVFLEPIKTTNVQNLRCMTTWVLAKDLSVGKPHIY